MSKIIKNIAVIILTLLITIAIYWLLFIDKKDVLNYSLKLLGNRLMAMVEDGAEREVVQTLYNKFLDDVSNRKISPERVEHVAANILNLSNTQSKISPKQAEALLYYSLLQPEKIERGVNDSIKFELQKRAESIHDTLLSQVQWEQLGERIKELNEFNSELQEASGEMAEEQKKLQENIRYHVDNGLCVTIDADLKENLLELKIEKERLKKELKQLEQERILEWRVNFNEEMKHEMELMRENLESLTGQIKFEQLESLKHLKSLKSLEALQELEKLKYIPVIDSDSIKQIVKKSLKDAGIEVE